MSVRYPKPCHVSGHFRWRDIRGGEDGEEVDRKTLHRSYHCRRPVKRPQTSQAQTWTSALTSVTSLSPPVKARFIAKIPALKIVGLPRGPTAYPLNRQLQITARTVSRTESVLVCIQLAENGSPWLPFTPVKGQTVQSAMALQNTTTAPLQSM